MVKKEIMLITVFVFLLFLIPPVSATKTESRGLTWDSVCDQETKTCTRSLYSGVRNVYEDNEWKRIEDARSLKDAWNVVYLESDPDFFLHPIDFNYTHALFNLTFLGNYEEYEYEIEGDKIKIKIKFKINETLYNETTLEPYENETEHELEWEIEDGETPFGTFRYEGIPLGKKFTFGGNSTTMTLQDADTENLGDSYIKEDAGDDNEGGRTEVYIRTDPGSNYRGLFKFNMSKLPNNITINTAHFYMYGDTNRIAGFGTRYYDSHRITGSWTEDAVTWNNKPNYIATYETRTTMTEVANTWFNWDCLNSAEGWYNGSYTNYGLLIKDSVEGDTNEYGFFDAKEKSSTSTRPKLVIVFNINSPVINSNYTVPTSPQYNQTINISANVTDYNSDLAQVNFTLISPNGSIVINAVNGSHVGDIWNSSSYKIDYFGEWFVNVSALDDTGLINSDNWNFSITQGTLTVTTPDGDQNHSYSQKLGDTELFNLTLSHDGNSNSSINFTTFGDITNLSRFNITFEENPTTVEPSETQKILINITSNSSLTAGTYWGIIKANRTILDENGINYVENITINMTVSQDAGDVDIVQTTWSIAKATTGFATRTFTIQNTGNYNLTGCNMSFTNTLGSTATFNISNFNVTNTTNVSISATVGGGSEGIDNSARFNIVCIATSTGGTDSDTLMGSLALTEVTGGGGGGYEPPVAVGNFDVYPSTRIVGVGYPESLIQPPFNVNLYNGNVSQKFYMTFSSEINPYCELIEYPEDVILSGGYCKFVFECYAPDGTVEGHVIIKSVEGGESSIPITLIGGVGLWEQFNAFFILFMSNPFEAFMMNFVLLGFMIPAWIILALILLAIIIIITANR